MNVHLNPFKVYLCLENMFHELKNCQILKTNVSSSISWSDSYKL